MYDNYIKLQIEGLTRGKDLHNAFILVLHEARRNCFYPVLISESGYEQVAAALRDHDYTCSRLMSKLAKRAGMEIIGVRLLRPREGDAQALIDFVQGNELVSIMAPVAEAAVAAMENGISFWLEKSLFESIVQNPATSDRMSLPLNAMNNKLVEEALQSAVAEDNYELASVLRDELQRRQGMQTNIHHDTISQ